VERIFLDANVLYSAAYLKDAALGRLWKLRNVELLCSAYAVEEVRRNLLLDRPSALARLEQLMSTLTVINPPQGLKLPPNIMLNLKDQPILLAAIHGKADYLLTGDARHFGHLYGMRIGGVMVLRPAQYFERQKRGHSHA
jgi:uncharacterized protein